MAARVNTKYLALKFAIRGAKTMQLLIGLMAGFGAGILVTTWMIQFYLRITKQTIA